MTFQQRLKAVQRGGNLTVADLARWFARPHPTVRGWAVKGVQPGGGPLDIEDVGERLAVLEKLVKAGVVFPLDRMAPGAKIARLEQVMLKHL